MRHAAGDMHDDIAVATCSVRGGRHQQGLWNAFQLIKCTHTVMQQQNGGSGGELRGQRFYRVRNLPRFERHQQQVALREEIRIVRGEGFIKNASVFTNQVDTAIGLGHAQPALNLMSVLAQRGQPQLAKRSASEHCNFHCSSSPATAPGVTA